jgi:predicted DsbA family dithiol-disulfide isomerase
MSELNFQHFTNAGVLNDFNLLINAAVSSGIAREEAESFLTSTLGVSEVLQAVEQVQGMGINSIPTLVIGGAVSLGGAVSAEDIVEAVSNYIDNNGDQKGGGGRLFKILEDIK